MKIDTSKISNKDDFVAILLLVIFICIFAFIIFLSATGKSFWAGFMAATLTWKWKQWLYEPTDAFLEKHWPSKD